MRFPWLFLFLFGVVLAPVGAGAVCPTTPTDCPTPQYKGLTVTPDASSVAALAASGAVTGAGFVSRFATPGPIGNGTPSTGAFTTLNATGAVSGTGFVSRFASPGPIGNTAASTGAFTTLSATSGGTLAGTFAGNVNFSGKLTGTSITWLNAVDYGVVADGVTSDDVALKAAVDACSATGTTLVLPPGQILLTGAAGSITLKDCAVRGVGIQQPTVGEAPSYGTTILLTSTTVTPFTIGNDWAFTGTVFYWPNQLDGVTVYPPLFANATTTTPTYGWYLDHVTIANAYIGIRAAGGAFEITNSYIYACLDAIQVRNIGDSFRLDSVHFTPGPWITLAPGFSAIYGTVSGNNTILHTYGGGNNAINFAALNIGAYGWRYGVKIESGVTVGIMEVDWILDSVATVIDASAGGTWAGFAGAPMRGSAGCIHEAVGGTGIPSGPSTCFNLGATSTLNLNGWRGGSAGTFIESSGSNVNLVDVSVSIGSINDASHYYGVHSSANPGGGQVLTVQNSGFTGVLGSVKTHGIKTDVAATRLIVQNNQFAYLNDSIDAQSAVTTIITGNYSLGIQGTADVIAASMASGANGVVYRDNAWDKPPISAVSTCGGSPTIIGAFSGFLTTGSAAGTACTLTLPWTPYGFGGGVCRFQTVNSVTAGANVSGSPPVWVLTFSGAYNGGNVFFDCPGQQ